jgi:23S rRNA pseudouridine2605 synthase
MRLQKILASSGIASRRAAEELIEQGRVTVNGKTAKLGDSADPAVDRIQYDGERLALSKPSYWLLHKPTGILTTLQDTHGRSTVMDLMPMGLGRLHPVGRLDRDTSGLVLMTNDGAMTHALLHPSRGSEKEYRVIVKGEVDEKTFGRLSRGIHLDDGKTAPARVGSSRYDPEHGLTTFALTLTEGRKRQIRRTLLVLGHPVKKLVRVRMGPLRLGRLAAGKARPLRADELRALKQHVQELGSRRR